MEYILTNDQANALIALIERHNQALQTAKVAEAAVQSQIELLKTFGKLDGEVKLEQRGQSIALVGVPVAKEAIALEDAPEKKKK